MAEENYYDLLMVARDAHPETIKANYRTVMRGFHPDNYRDDASRARAEERTKRINEARDTLLDPELRRAYDQRLADQEREDSAREAGASRKFEAQRREIEEAWREILRARQEDAKRERGRAKGTGSGAPPRPHYETEEEKAARAEAFKKAQEEIERLEAKEARAERQEAFLKTVFFTIFPTTVSVYQWQIADEVSLGYFMVVAMFIALVLDLAFFLPLNALYLWWLPAILRPWGLFLGGSLLAILVRGSPLPTSGFFFRHSWYASPVTFAYIAQHPTLARLNEWLSPHFTYIALAPPHWTPLVYFVAPFARVQTTPYLAWPLGILGLLAIPYWAFMLISLMVWSVRTAWAGLKWLYRQLAKLGTSSI